MAWKKICELTSLMEGEGVSIKTQSKPVALFRTQANQIYAVQEECPHRNQNVLSRGIVGDTQGRAKISCPLHKCSFHLDDGSPINCSEHGLEAFSTRIEAGWIYIDLPE